VTAGEPTVGGTRLKRVGLAALMVIAGLNVWTGSPAFALWVGARVQGDGPLTMAAVFVVVVVFAALSLTLGVVLSWLGGRYDRLTGHAPTTRQHVSWLRSMRGERVQYEGSPPPRLTALERILVAMVVIAFVLFEIWFFFFSTSPIDQRSGRGDIGPQPVAAKHAP
jgi:Zn-dependent protease with chaperone function